MTREPHNWLWWLITIDLLAWPVGILLVGIYIQISEGG